MNRDRSPIGVVTEGSFTGGLTVRINPTWPAEELRVGSFVVIDGATDKYFSLISDIHLRLTDAALASYPPDTASPFVRQALTGTATYATVEVKPSLMLEDADDMNGAGPVPVRNIPMHFATLREANEADFGLVFGQEDDTHFSLGHPPTMDISVPIDLSEFVLRSNGVFGQSGTGKSVLTRLLLFGLIKSDVASALILDMHNEYATARADEPEIAGLRDLFGTSKVRVFTLDSATDHDSSTRDVQIGLNQIEPEDIELLADELNLTDTFAQTTYQLQNVYKDQWLKELLNLDGDGISQFCAQTGAHEGAVNALKQKLARLRSKGYIVDGAEGDPVEEMLQHIKRKHHIILQFGRYSSILDYMLVANIITRRIHRTYTDKALENQRKGVMAEEQRKLVVVLEEAHKFLTPENAKQSIFGTIAREMRKYDVTLLIVDQRPSQIDSEIMSQLGTKVTGLLSEQRDIDSVLTGVGDRNQLRNMLASLRPRQECLIVGHAIPMPIMLQTRDYDRGELMKQVRNGYVPAEENPERALSFLRGEEED